MNKTGLLPFPLYEAIGLRLRTLLGMIPQVFRLFTHLFWMWMTLGWKVRKARNAFEKVLIRQGIRKEDAKRLSKQIKIAKDQIMDSIWKSAFK